MTSGAPRRTETTCRYRAGLDGVARAIHSQETCPPYVLPHASRGITVQPTSRALVSVGQCAAASCTYPGLHADRRLTLTLTLALTLTPNQAFEEKFDCFAMLPLPAPRAIASRTLPL